MKKKLISEIEDKEVFQSYFLVSDFFSGLDKKNKPYLSLTLKDRSGFINGRVWDNVFEIQKVLSVGSIISTKAKVQIFQEKKQLVLLNVTLLKAEEIDYSELLQKNEVNIESLLIKLSEVVKTVEDLNIRQLIELVLKDKEIAERIRYYPAAKTIHHAYEGGLLEHIVSICSLMIQISAQYPFLNKDLLIFGAIFHDIGKVFEFELLPETRYSNRGRLVGHMGIACELINEKSKLILGFSDQLKDILNHIVLSHHGKLEYGSPKTPLLLEALVVHMIDNFDSKINSMFHFLKNELSINRSEWSSYNQNFQNYLYLPILREQLAKNSSL